MMNLLLLLTLVVFSWPAKSDATLTRSNKLLQFVAREDGMGDVAIYSVLSKRCSRYMFSDQKKDCKLAVDSMIQILDFNVITESAETLNDGDDWGPKSFVFAAFKTRFLKLLSNPKTTTYLKELNQALFQYGKGQISKMSIWDFTLAHYTTPFQSAEVLAVLFQDTSRMKLHLAWLEKAQIEGNDHFIANKELLNRVIDSINLILDSSEEHYRSLFYPEQIQKDLNRNIYHFYVPMYLAMRLERAGHSKQSSYVAPLLLNLVYEFVTSASDYRYVFDDPETITAEGTLKDIYGGYCGAKIGIHGMNFNRNFPLIQRTFARSTQDAVMLLLR